MKKYLPLLLIFLFIFGCSTKEENECDILPKGVEYKIVLNNELYIFTEHGLVEKGFFVDFEKWRGEMEYSVLNKKSRIIYFDASLNYDSNILEGIYKIDLTRGYIHPVFIEGTKDGDMPSVSPDGRLLTFYLRNSDKSCLEYVYLLNLKTKETQKLADDAYCAIKPIWINNYQFIYYSHQGKLFLFDVDTLTKQDLQMSGYAPGALTPDGKHILLSGKGKTVLYNINTRTIDKVLFNESIYVNGMFWLPDGRGFIYYKHTWQDNMSLIAGDGVGGIAYYSLDRRKDVKLIGKMSLTGGFVVPADIELNPVDNEHNRRILLFSKDSPHGVKKICVNK